MRKWAVKVINDPKGTYSEISTSGMACRRVDKNEPFGKWNYRPWRTKDKQVPPWELNWDLIWTFPHHQDTGSLWCLPGTGSFCCRLAATMYVPWFCFPNGSINYNCLVFILAFCNVEWENTDNLSSCIIEPGSWEVTSGPEGKMCGLPEVLYLELVAVTGWNFDLTPLGRGASIVYM